MAKFDEYGREIPDQTPVELPLGFKRPESIHEMIRRYVRSEAFNARMAAEGRETEDEANDFEVEDDDNDPLERFITRHELSALAAEELKELTGREEWDRLRGQFKPKENGNGSTESETGTGRAGRSGEAVKTDGKSESSPVAGSSKEAGRVAESKGGS